jgi:zinc transporter ZupT
LATSFFVRPLLAALLAIVCAFTGIALAGGRRARILIPVGGALLAAVALFGLLPELIHEIGWAAAVGLATAGFVLLSILDRLGYSVCPSCQHGRSFAGSLVAATAVHAFVDGWGMMAVGNRGSVSLAIATAILLHKIPEGLALGAILRASAPQAAIGLAVIAELPTVLGGATSLWATPKEWVNYPLALAAGTFLFLGLHALWSRPSRSDESTHTDPAVY